MEIQSVYSRKIKLRLYKRNGLSVLLYGSECWRMTGKDNRGLATFQTTSGESCECSGPVKSLTPDSYKPQGKRKWAPVFGGENENGLDMPYEWILQRMQE